jgi:hypothetical protein
MKRWTKDESERLLLLLPEDLAYDNTQLVKRILFAWWLYANKKNESLVSFFWAKKKKRLDTSQSFVAGWKQKEKKLMKPPAQFWMVIYQIRWTVVLRFGKAK